MVYSKLTYRAMNIAYQAHHGQYDKNGAPYIYHPIHLAEQMEDEIACCVALLHDVAEDTEWTLEALAEQFPQEVIDALTLLTHQPGVPYMEYVKTIRENPTARMVKLADLAHNSDRTRVNPAHPMDEKKRDALLERYEKARAYLMFEEE